LSVSHKWQLTKRKVEALPMALTGELDYDEITDSVRSKSDDVSAERAVRRYLAIANNLVSAAASGDFPSRDYFKL
jgi:phage-related minor tail protein